MDGMDYYRARVCKDGRVFQIYLDADENGKWGQYYASVDDWLVALPGQPSFSDLLVNTRRPVQREHVMAFLEKKGWVKSENDIFLHSMWIRKYTNPQEYEEECKKKNKF